MDNAKYAAGEQGVDLDVDNLYVKQAIANDGPRMKRIRPAPMGRAYRYQRRLTHIVLSVAERGAAGGLVTKVEEPTPASAPGKAEKSKKAVPATAKAKEAAAKEAKTKVKETKPAAKGAKSKAKETKTAEKKSAAAKKKSGK